MHASRDIGALAEVATDALSFSDYEAGVLAILRRRVGFDIAVFRRTERCGMYGIDPDVEQSCRPLWDQFRSDTLPVISAALQQRGVAVDVEVLGLRRMQRLAYYRELMQPHRGTSTAILSLSRAGRPLGTLVLGRTHGDYRDRELEYLRALVPTLSVCEAAVAAPKLDDSVLQQLTPREREVLSHLPLGHTNAQIALALGTAERTVRNQLSSIYAKLGVGSRAEAVAWAARNR